MSVELPWKCYVCWVVRQKFKQKGSRMNSGDVSMLWLLAEGQNLRLAVAAVETLGEQPKELLAPYSQKLRALLSHREPRIRLSAARMCIRIQEIDSTLAQTLFLIADLGSSAPIFIEPLVQSGAQLAQRQGDDVLRSGVLRNIKRQSLVLLSSLPGEVLETVKVDLAKLLATGLFKYGESDGLTALFTALQKIGARLSGVEAILFEALVRHYYSVASSGEKLWDLVCFFPIKWELVGPTLQKLNRSSAPMEAVYASEILEVYDRRAEFFAGKVAFSEFGARYVSRNNQLYHMLGRDTDRFVAHLMADTVA